MSIHRRKTKGGRARYVVRWREGGRAGVNRQRAFDTKRDADLFEASRRRAQQLGQLAATVVGSEQSFANFVDEWWEAYATVHLRPATLATHATELDRWVIPSLGSIPLRELTRAVIVQWMAAITSTGAGAPTVNRCLAVVQGILHRAVEWERIATNPAVGLRRLPHARDARINARSAETVERIRRVLGEQDAALVSVLAYEGLRSGEAYALEWGDVLTEDGAPRKRLLVRRALSDHELSFTKSTREREPELFAPIAEELAALYFARDEPHPRSLVFPDTRGGYLRRQNWRTRVWLPALRSISPCSVCQASGRAVGAACVACAGTGAADYFRPHDLRHTAATLLIYGGHTINEVAEHLGHADPGFTARTYTHVYRDADGRRGVSIEDLIGDARGRENGTGLRRDVSDS